jgi:hypothetical protein
VQKHINIKCWPDNFAAAVTENSVKHGSRGRLRKIEIQFARWDTRFAQRVSDRDFQSFGNAESGVSCRKRRQLPSPPPDPLHVSGQSANSFKVCWTVNRVGDCGLGEQLVAN